VPVLGVLGLLVQDWMPLIDEYHYCACGPCGLLSGMLMLDTDTAPA
jgi:hypothetical protein